MNDMMADSTLEAVAPCFLNTSGAYSIIMLMPVSCWTAAKTMPTMSALR